MLPPAAAAVESVDGAAPAGLTARGGIATDGAVAPARAGGPSRMIPLLLALLMLALWGVGGTAIALVAPVPIPLPFLTVYALVGLSGAALLALLTRRILRQHMAAQVRAAATAQRAFLQNALDQLDYGLLIWDGEDRLVLWNRPFADLMARAAPRLRRDMSYEALLRIWMECGYTPPNAGQRWLQDCLERHWLGASSDTRSIDGRDFAFVERSDDDGITTLCVTDVTESRARERALKDSEERYSLALIASNEALWDCDLRNGRSYLSQRACNIIGGADRDKAMTRETWTSHIHPDDLVRQQSALESHLSGRSETYDIEYRVIVGDGEVRWVHDCGLALRDSTGAPYRIAGSLGDISERKRAEQELTAARDAAQLADRARSEFMSNITHEFKTPLNSVIGFSEMLSQAVDDLDAEERQTYASEIHRAGTRLDRLVSDLLDLARASSAQDSVADSQFDLVHCLRRAAELQSHRAAIRSVAIRIAGADSPVPVIGDLGKLKHGLFNLLGHAIERADPNSAIDVTIGHGADGGAAVTLTWCAAGVTTAQLRGALQPLTPDDAQGAQRADGVDLALAVVESFVKLHGGALDLSAAGADRVAAVLRLPAERTI